MALNAFLSELIGLLIFLGFLCISDAGKGILDKFHHVQTYGAVSDRNDGDGVALNKFYDIRKYGAVSDKNDGDGVILNKFYDVRRYGAVSDGKTDNSQAFLTAWTKACNCNGKCWALVPSGIYKLGPVVFFGPCQGITGFLILGTVVAPNDPAQFTDQWIMFKYVDQLLVRGGGTLDGQGASAWPLNDCKTNPHCKQLPATMRFDFVTNSRIHHINSVNSKNAHINFYSCTNITINQVNLIAPADSPNTDGIRLGASNYINISRSIIATGDDCIAMIDGTNNVFISYVSCGPGHGISIGSIGRGLNEQVHDIEVLNCNITHTQNGLRVKTWAPSLSGMVSNLTFQYISMNEVQNPIVFDQNYCPRPPCDDKAQSLVKISNVTFKNIFGTSSSKTAVNFNCSSAQPCDEVTLDNINLTYNGPGGPAVSSCMNVEGNSIGRQMPPECL